MATTRRSTRSAPKKPEPVISRSRAPRGVKKTEQTKKEAAKELHARNNPKTCDVVKIKETERKVNTLKKEKKVAEERKHQSEAVGDTSRVNYYAKKIRDYATSIAYYSAKLYSWYATCDHTLRLATGHGIMNHATAEMRAWQHLQHY